MAISEFDDQALEEAVLVKEATGATVTAVGLRAEGIEQALRVAYARGADRVVVVEAGEIDPYDSRTAALAFAEALPPAGARPRARRRADAVRRVRSDGAAARGRARLAAGERRRRGQPWPTGRARVVQEYAGGRLAVLGLQLPAVVGVQSASSPPRYVSMTRLRQAMTEASAETLDVSVEAPAARAELVALARPEPQARRDDARGRCDRWPRRSSRCCANGALWCADGRRPRLHRSRGQRPAARVRATAGGRRRRRAGGSRRRARGRRRRRARGGGRGARGVAPRALARTSRRRTWRCSRRRSRARAGPRPAREHHGRLRPRAPRPPRRRPSLRRLLHRPVAGRAARRSRSARIYGGQLHATVRTPLPAVFAINSAALHEEPHGAGRGERIQLAPPAELDSLRTTFVEAVAPPGRGRGPRRRPT